MTKRRMTKKRFETVKDDVKRDIDRNETDYEDRRDKQQLIDSVNYEDFQESKKESKKIKVIYRPTVMSASFIAEETWDREHAPVYTVYDFTTETTEEKESLELGERDEKGRKIIYKPLDNDMLRKGLVIVPKQARPCDFIQVLKEADEFVDLCYDPREQKAAVKVFVRQAIGSWFLDRFTDNPKVRVAGAGKFAPIIAIRGTSGSGKNRLLFALRLLSYRPYYELCTSRVPSLFRPIDMWEGTLCIDEADFLYSNVTSEVSHFLNSRCYGTPISRQNSKNPKITDTFSNFGLTMLTQRGSLGDDATSTRSLPFWSLRTKKQLPTIETDEMLEHGLALQDKLLYLRFKYYKTFKIDAAAWISGIRDHRLNSAMLPLLALSKIDPSILNDIQGTVKQFADIRVREKTLTPDGLLVAHLWDLVNQETPMISIWNRNLYFTTEVEDKEGNKVVVPLTTSILRDELAVSPREARETAYRLNLTNPDRKLKAVIKVGGKVYKPIFFEPERLEMALADFIVGYQDGDLGKRLHFQKGLFDEEIEKIEGNIPPETVTSVTCVTSTLTSDEMRKEKELECGKQQVTEVTEVTLLGGISPTVSYQKERVNVPHLGCGGLVQVEVSKDDSTVTGYCGLCHRNVVLTRGMTEFHPETDGWFISPTRAEEES